MNGKKNLHLLQVLRGVASLLVVLFHLSENYRLNFDRDLLGNIFYVGYLGLDLFFVLSGFIITYTCFAYTGVPQNVIPYMKRRAIRIFPSYWIIITGFLLFQLLLTSFYTTGYTFTFENLVSTYLLLPDHEMVNGVSWTLTFEIYFYLLFAVAFFIPWKKVLAAGMIGYLVLLVAINLYGSRPGYSFLAMLANPMVIEFFMGIIAGVLLIKFTIPCPKWVIIAGLMLILAGCVLDLQAAEIFKTLFGRVLFYGTGAFLIIIGSVGYELPRPKLKIPGMFLLLGDASYTLYLLHLPLVAAGCKILLNLNTYSGTVGYLALGSMLLVICVVSILFHKWIEKPVIDFLSQKMDVSWKSKKSA